MTKRDSRLSQSINVKGGAVRIEEILNNILKFDDCCSNALKKKDVFKQNVKKYKWIVCSVSEKKRQIEELLLKIGFELELGMRGTYIGYCEDANRYYKVILGTWVNNYYDNISGQCSWSRSKEYPRTIRNGEIFYENGIMKTMTARGVYTGD